MRTDGYELLFSGAFSAGGIIYHAGFVTFGNYFALVRNFMVQSKNMTCLTVRFHFNSSILLLVLRTTSP
ncbi:hypothetical protein HMPREF1617_05172 [Escherichia coli 908675]|nr:hypothetical protein HMPREF1597_05242 [Escherichia coli 907701]ESE08561.1 hypothetical protein HMPREF1617_05172 [Escherichia coli 908675]ESE19155.1 hypothetical protein HMPREF1623_03871 [Escherichia coli 910096-2]